VKLSGTVSLPAEPPQVWALLTDAQRLARLLPGCERLDPDGADCFKAVMKFGVAAISGKYGGSLRFLQLKPPHSLTLQFDGRGLPGFVRGQAGIELIRKGAATELRYSGEAQIGGVVASVGQRLLEAAARQIVRQFFDAAAAELRAAQPPAGSLPPAAQSLRPARGARRTRG
jgi:carbon monoxide dehydrogenase subunit G